MLKSGLQTILLSWFPFLIIFFVIPLSLYLPNQTEFDFNIYTLVPFLILSGASLLLSIMVLIVREPFKATIVNFLFYAGVYFFISDLIFPWQTAGESLFDFKWSHLVYGLVEIGLLVIIFYLFRKFPVRKYAGGASVFIIVFLATQIVSTARGLSLDTHIDDSAPAITKYPEPVIRNSGGNVYHLTFDSFGTDNFLDYLDEVSERTDFPGFVFFEKNRSNFAFTWVSVASYMTGTLYKEGSLEKWMESWKEKGVLGTFSNANYKVSMYIPDRSWKHDNASEVRLTSEYQDDKNIKIYKFADAWSSRIIPNFLHPAFYDSDSGPIVKTGPISKIISKWDSTTRLNGVAPASVDIFRQLIQDESKRADTGEYVFSHIYLPHWPHVMDQDCNYSPGDGYPAQSKCSIRLIKELVLKLKELGRYDDSTIIIQSDHGSLGYVPVLHEPTLALEHMDIDDVPDDKLKRVKSATHTSKALLFIKPPHAVSETITVSNRESQLLDIPRTISELTSIPVNAEYGQSLFSEEFPSSREIHFYKGFDQVVNGKTLRFGSTLFEGNWDHFSYTEGKGWDIYSDLSVVW